MSEEMITLDGDTFSKTFWGIMIARFKANNAKINDLIHKHSLGKGWAGENTTDILIDAYEELEAENKRYKAAFEAVGAVSDKAFEWWTFRQIPELLTLHGDLQDALKKAGGHE